MSAYSSSGLSDERRAIQEMAMRFAREAIAPFALQWDRDKFFPVETLRAAAALGMAAIYVGEEFGGAGLSRIDAALIFEALATGCPTVSAYLSIHNMCAWMIDAFGSPDQRRRFLPKLVTMETLTSYCLTEPDCGSDAAALRMRAVRRGDAYVLSGRKQFISGAGAGGDAHLYIVMARTGGQGAEGVSAFLVEGSAAGLSFGANERKMGWNAQPTRIVAFEDCVAPLENRLGAEGEGFKMAMAALDGGRLNIGACSLGGGQSALEKALIYAHERQAFGRSLTDFQALQFRLADMATQLEAARALLWRAAAALDVRAPDATRLCAMAKRVATDAGFAVADDAMQIFGGYGYLADYGVEKIQRDLRVHRILEGTNEIMRVIIAKDLLKERGS
ncbi:acyl-CoA dehydrogenase family protein [Methylocystis parvus]|uniref:Acyl-CoA dehydrogenase n=2 Tax=Methylocystis parvus TaxID=134 RepID=A0A6B8M211_9HYPH|nr:acyl-CoA dehydrogenase family protein [Methylocystis parvus]QGM97844.1 acyl-CoA dehydrogenase [Methylocystis parvus]